MAPAFAAALVAADLDAAAPLAGALVLRFQRPVRREEDDDECRTARTNSSWELEISFDDGSASDEEEYERAAGDQRVR